ncbi:hypothetical protein [Massilia sp. SYSU DXS3249]
MWTVASLPLLFGMVFKPMWWASPGFALLALAAAVSWGRAFDRSLQARVDGNGIWTKRYGMISWSEMAEARVVPGKMSYLRITFREVEPWKSRASLLRRLFHGRIKQGPFLVSLPLQHTGVDAAALSRFLKERSPKSALA